MRKKFFIALAGIAYCVVLLLYLVDGANQRKQFAASEQIPEPHAQIEHIWDTTVGPTNFVLVEDTRSRYLTEEEFHYLDHVEFEDDISILDHLNERMKQQQQAVE